MVENIQAVTHTQTQGFQRCGLCHFSMVILAERTGRTQKLSTAGNCLITVFLMSYLNGRKSNRLRIYTCGYNSNYMFLLGVFSFFFFLTAANEAGETPLDIARRLKHAQCEELVSAPGFNFATCICELKRLNNNLFLCVLFTVESSAGGEIQRPRPCGV